MIENLFVKLIYMKEIMVKNVYYYYTSMFSLPENAPKIRNDKESSSDSEGNQGSK